MTVYSATFPAASFFVEITAQLGDANRSGKVERPFSRPRTQLPRGRTFTDWDDLHQKARDWRDRQNGQFRKRLQASYPERTTYERVIAASIFESTPSCAKITVPEG